MRFVLADLFKKALTNKGLSEVFKDDLTIQTHVKDTRNAKQCLKIKVTTENAFVYSGTQIYNELPLRIRKTGKTTEYEKSLKAYSS